MPEAVAGTAVERADAAHAQIAAPSNLLPSDDEIRRMYRIAEALAMSGAFGDVKKAEAAFAKMVVGRDLGLSPAQAMTGVQLVEGGIQMHYSTLGQFIRSRPGYDYRAGWIKQVVGESDTVFVWHDEEDPLDDREVTGAAIVFYVDGEQRGLARFTIDDARKAQLLKDDKPKAAWNTSRRNMLLARAMSNGVKWFVPEVMNGMPVYAVGELEQAREGRDLTAPVGDGDDEGQGFDLGPKVDAVIERAAELGHRGLSNRASIELAVGNRAPGIVNEWVVAATAELDRFAAEKAAVGDAEPVAGATPEPVEDVDAEPVVGESARSESTDPREHAGHQIALTRSDGADDELRCADCDVVLVVPEPDPEPAAEPPPDPRSVVERHVEREGGEVE